jgi:hypothetical protein
MTGLSSSTLTGVPKGRTQIAAVVRRSRPRVLRAAWWAFRSTNAVKRQLAAGVARPVVPSPPNLPLSAGIGVDAVIGRLQATCLEAAMVRQRWLSAHGIRRDVVIGLPTFNFGPTPAHAWVDGFDVTAAEGHQEIHRIPVASDERAAHGEGWARNGA